MGLLGVARAKTAVGVRPETFLLLLLCNYKALLVEGVCLPALHLPCHLPPPLQLIGLPEPEELPGGVRPMADRPVLCAVLHKPLHLWRTLHPQFPAELRWHGLCFSVSALPSIRFKPCISDSRNALQLMPVEMFAIAIPISTNDRCRERRQSQFC
jgi:hypothetical protein